MGQVNSEYVKNTSKKCPCCGYPMVVRTSRQLTKIFIEENRQCKNIECGIGIVYEVTAARVTSPSGLDMTNAGIPLSQKLAQHQSA